MPLYKDKRNIEEPKIVGQTIKLPRGMYPKDMINRIEKFTGDDYATNLINRSKYTITGSAIGLFAGIGLAMFLKKGKWGGAILGAMAGAAAGYGYTKLVERVANKPKQQTVVKK